VRLPDPLDRLPSALLPLEPEPAVNPAALDRLRPSAVLVLFYPAAGDIAFVLTARPETLSRHPGQISLPGGLVEPQDRSLWDTAVREAREELGVRPGRIVPLGRLADVTLRVSEHVITPFVGWNPVRPRFEPDGREVAEVLEVPLRLLLDTSSIETETWDFRARTWRVTFYRFGDRVVWGATAVILHDLQSRLDPSASRLPMAPGSVLPA
jgi:8-oxo-dGTP pyrophosphatase MutT (NUDIX family)